MRQIKFRAWDAKQKRMIPSVGFTDSDIGRRWQRETYMVDDGSDLTSYDWIPMQYTGLKDRNGKEIYEGDIVENPMMGDRWQVIFDDGMFKYELAGGEYDEAAGYMAEPWEVIGNIYENPELLN